MRIYKIVSLSPLLFVCTAIVTLMSPIMSCNINDPNMIVYFNADEGYRMDVIWSYFSGEIRDSYQGGYEYGLLMIYLSDFARMVLSRFVDFDPGTFVLILRWLHLIFWVGSLIWLWRLITYHFGGGWQPLLCILILVTRPAFPYFMNSLKPDPVVLFFMLIGLDYSLRVVNKPSKINLLIAIACASLALLVKFSGIFLLPTIILAMFFAEKYKKSEDPIFPQIKRAWCLYLVIALVLIFLPLSSVLFYVRKSTGLTLYDQFGLWGSLLQNKLVLFLVLVGVCCIFLSALIWFFNKNYKLTRIMGVVNRMNSYAFVVSGIFLGLIFLFGFRWIINPKYFLVTYSQIAPLVVPYAFGSSLNTVSESGLFSKFFFNFIDKIRDFDPILIVLFVFYIVMELWLIRKKIRYDELKLSKRLILVSFILPFLIFIFISMTRAEQVHMLPFIAAMLILNLQGISMFYNTFKGNKWVKKIFLAMVFILIVFDVSFNGNTVRSQIIVKYHQHESIVYEIAKWWKQYIPQGAIIVADHPTRVYIPPGYVNVKVLRTPKALASKIDGVEELRQMVDQYHPQFIYYNEGSNGMPSDNTPWPPIEVMLPDKKVKLVKTFESAGRRYQRSPDDKFVIYQVYYDEEPKW